MTILTVPSSQCSACNSTVGGECTCGACGACRACRKSPTTTALATNAMPPAVEASDDDDDDDDDDECLWTVTGLLDLDRQLWFAPDDRVRLIAVTLQLEATGRAGCSFRSPPTLRPQSRRQRRSRSRSRSRGSGRRSRSGRRRRGNLDSQKVLFHAWNLGGVNAADPETVAQCARVVSGARLHFVNGIHVRNVRHLRYVMQQAQDAHLRRVASAVASGSDTADVVTRVEFLFENPAAAPQTD